MITMFAARMQTSLRNLAFAALVAALPSAFAHAEDAKTLLAPTGKLRVGIYAGSPTSSMTDPTTHQVHGLSHDLGAIFATQLGVPVDYVQFQRIADIIAAMKNAEVDFTVSNATPARAADVNFSPPLLSVELGYLVPANSSITSADQIDKPGLRIGVTKGGTSEKVLGAKFPNATIVPAENVKIAVAMFNRNEIDLYATNKPTLFEMADAMPGARILDGKWGLEHLAVAVPKGRDAAMPVVTSFVKDVQTNGTLAKAEQDAGLRGAAKAE